jgi:ribosomal protein L31E
MGAAWTLSDCYVHYPAKTENILFSDSLNTEIRKKAIQKINESRRVKEDDKERLKLKKESL